jgi:arylsulfotransferase ASST
MYARGMFRLPGQDGVQFIPGKMALTKVSKPQIHWFVRLIGFSVLAASCRDAAPFSPVRQRPGASQVTIEHNPLNALSLRVVFRPANADSARLIYWTEGTAPDSTPFQLTQLSSDTLVALGLHAGQIYQASLDVAGEDTVIPVEVPSLTAGALPIPLSALALTVTGANGPGLILTGVTIDSVGYAVAFDRAGEIRWYRPFALHPGESVDETKQQPNGNFTAFVGATFGWQPTYGRYYEFRPDGAIIKDYAATAPYYTDNHELLIAGGDQPNVLMFGYDIRRMDLTAIGGGSNVQLAGHTLLRQTPEGAVRFLWSAWDNFSLQDWQELPANVSTVTNTDFDHPNSIDVDGSGNYVISFRDLDEVTNIDAVTGRMNWRFGGRNNQFTLVGDPLGGFAGQHSVRVLPNGHLLIYDDGLNHGPPESRGVEYNLDVSAKTATMAWEFRHSPPLYTQFVGSVQRWQDGATLVGFGGVGVATLVGSDGSVVWEGTLAANGSPLAVYRLIAVRSLYRFAAP